ncbi:MAG: NAD-dependent epimerase/dehydratase family protein [Candidatus Aenigmarchaeota archaeon]|nr:NAD-dependent epimerase/dehydratase family protein [Candidatus Aenigmarchaeota archaeon]
MTTLVTGCSGFIGMHLMEALGEAVGVDARPLPRALPGVRFHQIDILDPRLDEVFAKEKVTKVVHLAARSDIRSAEGVDSYLDVNIRGTARLLELCAKHAVKQFVFASSSSVYGGNPNPPFREDDPIEPLSIYGITKRTGELLCHYYSKKFGLSCTVFRFFTVYGERGRADQAVRTFTRLVMEGRPIQRFGDGRSERDYIHVHDVVRGIQAALARDAGTHVVNLGTGRAVPLNDLIRLIGEAAGKEPLIQPVPDIVENVETTCANIDRARALLGWVPTIPIEEGVRRFVAWYRESGALEDAANKPLDGGSHRSGEAFIKQRRH